MMVVSNDDFLVAFVLNVKNTVVYLKKEGICHLDANFPPKTQTFFKFPNSESQMTVPYAFIYEE
jgi:hypothetical protein